MTKKYINELKIQSTFSFKFSDVLYFLYYFYVNNFFPYSFDLRNNSYI